MAASVTMPLWLAVAMAILAVIALIDRFFGPALGWWLRRRANRAIDELNQRLRLKIPPFKLARRRQLIEQLMFDPEVLKAVEDEAKARGEPKSVAHARARRYAREIIPSFSAYTYFRVGTSLAKRISTALYRVRIGAFDEADPLPGARRCLGGVRHQSPLQHGLRAGHVSGLGELGAQLRGGRMGAGVDAAEPDQRHGRLLRAPRQLQPALPQGAGALRPHGDGLGRGQAVFPEGGLTRDGALRPPKLGILSYMASGFDPQGPRDVVFVPVGLNYDRVLEDRIQVAAAATPQGERPRFAFNPARARGLPRLAACGSGCAGAGTASATPASASAGRCRCATTCATGPSTCARCPASGALPRSSASASA